MRAPRPTNRLVQWFISVLILFLIVRHVGLSALSAIVRDVRPDLLSAAIVLIPLSFLVRALRWYLIINKDGTRAGLRSLYRLGFMGVALNFIVPAGIGEIARAYYGYKESGLKEEMLSSSLADKLIGLLSVFLLGIASSLWLHLYGYTAIASAGLVVSGFFVFFPRYVPWGALNRILRLVGVKDLDEGRLLECFSLPSYLVGLSVVLSLLAWAITYFQFYLLCLACSAQVTILYVYALAPLVVLARMFPFTFSGFGSQEIAVIFLLGRSGVEPAAATTVSLLFSIVFIVIPGMFGGAAIWMARRQ